MAERERGWMSGNDFDPQVFAESIETLLLGGPRSLSPRDLAERAGVDREDGRRLWQSMGFASVADEDLALTELDLAAARSVHRALDIGLATFDEIVSLSRLAGQIFAQLAEGEGEALFAMSVKQEGAEDFNATVERLADEILPFVESLHSYVWRRQLAAFAARKAAQLTKHADAYPSATVGFADISGYTALSRRIDHAELAALLERFESIATGAVGAHNGRVVKLIGDAVLYTADEPVDGVRIALDLLDAWPETQPPVRAGVASGPILRRLGDVFGPTVNIASRLTSLGKPGQVRIDDATRAAVQDGDGLRLTAQPPQDVRGYDQLESWSVER